MSTTFYPDGLSILTEQGIGSHHFACDLTVCKGACCTMPAERGAPILPIERSQLEHIYPFIKHRLSHKAVNVIESLGLWHREDDGTYTIPTVDGAECIFVEWDGDIAKCAIQNAYRSDEITTYEKPISCHLFPLRISYDAEKKSAVICYEQIDECSGGRANGEQVHQPLVTYLESPLIRAFGAERAQAIIHHTTNASS